MSALGAHPRSRGENSARALTVSCQTGSSPLTRGKLPVEGVALEDVRLIPAHAGKTPCVSTCVSRCPAHPRSRGENSAVVTSSQTRAGSSPLTRGKRCARRGHARHGVAHPRSRGENTPRSSRVMSPYGSSPLTRGKPTGFDKWSHRDRLIPAHAGKTPLPIMVGGLPSGSSPLTRGKP